MFQKGTVEWWLYGTPCSMNLIFPSVTVKPVLEYCKQTEVEKGDIMLAAAL